MIPAYVPVVDRPFVPAIDQPFVPVIDQQSTRKRAPRDALQIDE